MRNHERLVVVDLTPTEFDVLAYLIHHRDHVVSCREIAAHLRDCDLDARLIRTVRSEGYIFAPWTEILSCPSFENLRGLVWND